MFELRKSVNTKKLKKKIKKKKLRKKGFTQKLKKKDSHKKYKKLIIMHIHTPTSISQTSNFFFTPLI